MAKTIGPMTEKVVKPLMSKEPELFLRAGVSNAIKQLARFVNVDHPQLVEDKGAFPHHL